MRDHEGIEWLTVAEAALVANVTPATIRQWIVRGKLPRNHLIAHRLYVPALDVYKAERATRGRYLAQRLRHVSQ
jgi:predicted site-specific integrase-resolvase